MTFSGASDNQGNTALVTNNLTGKFPLYIILLELTEQLRSRNLILDLHWQRRDLNQAADDLSNGDFGAFSKELRINPALGNLDWILLPKFYKDAVHMHDLINSKKAAKTVNSVVPLVRDPKRKARKKKRMGLRVTDPW